MKVRIKGIEFDRFEDAPFNGALLSSIDCHNNCKNCFNQSLKNLPNIEYESKELIEIIKENIFCEGVIFGGLEWTEQPEELKELVNLCILNNLKVIIYTGLTENDFQKKYLDLYILPIYIKFGRYIEEEKVSGYKVFNVNLSSKNQYIKFMG